MTVPLSAAVDRAFDILELIGRSPRGVTNSELSRKLAIPKSSASYILRTMEGRGYLRLDRETGRYKLGFKLLLLGRGVLAGIDLKESGQTLGHFLERWLADIVSRSSLRKRT